MEKFEKKYDQNDVGKLFQITNIYPCLITMEEKRPDTPRYNSTVIRKAQARPSSMYSCLISIMVVEGLLYVQGYIFAGSFYFKLLTP